jgi:hypothetical protein
MWWTPMMVKRQPIIVEAVQCDEMAVGVVDIVCPPEAVSGYLPDCPCANTTARQTPPYVDYSTNLNFTLPCILHCVMHRLQSFIV